MTHRVDIDRRLGARDSIEIPVRWMFVESSRRRRWARATRSDAGAAMDAVIVDLSVSGAALRATTVTELQLGVPITLDLDGCSGTAIICRTQPAREAGQTIYGVAFVDMTPSLRDHLWSLLGVTSPT